MSDPREDKRRADFINDHRPADWVELERDERNYEFTVERGIEVSYPPRTDVVVYKAPVTSVMLRP